MSQTKRPSPVAVRLSGTGGQGLILAGKVLAEAAALHDGLNVVQTNSYGPEARGGASRTDVVIGPGEVDVLASESIHVLVCLSQKACDTYFGRLVERGLLITDSSQVEAIPTNRAVEIPITPLAIEECGNPLVANMIALGALASISDIVTFDSLKAAVVSKVPAAFRDLNLRAVELGIQRGAEALAAKPKRLTSGIVRFSYLRQG